MNFQTNARVIAGGADTNFFVLIYAQKLGMWVEIGHHAAHRAFDQHAVVHGLDILLLYALQHLGQQPRFVPGKSIFGCIALGQYTGAERER